MDDLQKALEKFSSSLTRNQVHSARLKYKHIDSEEADPELKERREQERLFYFSPSIIHGETSRKNCFYCEVPLIEETNLAREKQTGEGWRAFYSCPECGVHYDLPLPEKEQRKMNSQFGKRRILENSPAFV